MAEQISLHCFTVKQLVCLCCFSLNNYKYQTQRFQMLLAVLKFI